MVAFGECGFAAEIPAFAGMEYFFNFATYLFSIPASPPFPFPRKRESPQFLTVKNDAVRALPAPNNREIPAFAGMEEGAGMEAFFTLRRLRGGCEREAVAGVEYFR